MKLDCGWFDLCSYSILNNKDKAFWLTWYSMNLGIVGALEALCKFEEPLSSNRRAMAALAAARRRVAAQRRQQASWASEHRNDRGTSKCCMWAWRPEKFSSEPKVLIYRYLKAFSQFDMKRFDYELNCEQLTVPKSKSERGNCCSDTDIYSTLEDQSLFEV